MSLFKITGLDNLEKQLKQLEKNVEELSQKNQVSFAELFPPSFMQKNTSFSSMDELIKAGGFKVESQEDFESIPEAEFDKHIAANSKFKNWEDMLNEAYSQYISPKIGF